MGFGNNLKNSTKLLYTVAFLSLSIIVGCASMSSAVDAITNRAVDTTTVISEGRAFQYDTFDYDMVKEIEIYERRHQPPPLVNPPEEGKRLERNWGLPKEGNWGIPEERGNWGIPKERNWGLPEERNWGLGEGVVEDYNKAMNRYDEKLKSEEETLIFKIYTY